MYFAATLQCSPCSTVLSYSIFYILLDRKKKSVSHIRFTNINLSQIDQEVLSSFIVRLTAVILDLNYLTSAQVKAIFEKVKLSIK